MTFERALDVYEKEQVAEPPKGIFTVGTYPHKLREVLQPKVDRDGQVVGAEALVWSGEEGAESGIPDDLLEHLEQHNEVHNLTLAMFRRTCEQLAYWRDEGLSFPISVNIEVGELVAELPDELDAILEETGAPCESIELELTERTRLSDEHRSVLRELRARGLRLALDDYGTGEADDDALGFFEQGDTIKVDRALVEEGTAYDKARELMQAGFHVVIEGVPEADRDKVPDGCDVQSFELSGVPGPAASIEERLLREQEHERKAA